MITNIAFDVGGVLLGVSNSEDVKDGIVEFLFNKIEIKESEDKIKQIVDEIAPQWFSETDTGFNLWSKYFSPEVAQKIANEYKYFHFQKYQLIQSMLDLCKKLSQNYQIGILSNFSGEMVVEDHYFNKNNFFPIIYSGKVGVKKPNPEIYKIFCERANCKPENVLFIDDRQENVTAAEKFGMNGIFFTNQKNLEKKLTKLNLL